MTCPVSKKRFRFVLILHIYIIHHMGFISTIFILKEKSQVKSNHLNFDICFDLSSVIRESDP